MCSNDDDAEAEGNGSKGDDEVKLRPFKTVQMKINYCEGVDRKHQAILKRNYKKKIKKKPKRRCKPYNKLKPARN